MTLPELVYEAERRARRGAGDLASLARLAMTQKYSLAGAQKAAEEIWRYGVEAAGNLRRTAPEIPRNYRIVQDKLYQLKRK